MSGSLTMANCNTGKHIKMENFMVPMNLFTEMVNYKTKQTIKTEKYMDLVCGSQERAN